MITALTVVDLFVALAMIGVILIQRSEGGGLGIGASQGMGAFMSGRGTANLLTRGTAVLATLFLLLSLGLGILNRGTGGVGSDILQLPRTATHGSPAHPDPLARLPAAPVRPAGPSVPTR